MTTFAVFKGEYPFDQFLGYVSAPEDRPDMALEKAINAFNRVDPHPVVEPRVDEALAAFKRNLDDAIDEYNTRH